MINSSPITTWEGAAAFFNFAGGAGALFWFWVAVALCITPLWVALAAERRAEIDHG